MIAKRITVNINIYMILLLLFSSILFASGDNLSKLAEATILFQEDFEDTNFASRGWYDALRGTLTTDEYIDGSTACLECKFLQGEKGCEGGTPGRHLFEETDEIYLSYYVKYSANYTGSDKPYHPHEFHFITNENSVWVGPAYTHLTLYIEHSEGEPLLAIQDAENIDESNIGVDLTDISEERAVAGCNGDSDGHGVGDCYSVGELHRNGKQWRAGNIYFQDTPGKYYKNDWHFIEAYFKLNSIVDGKAIPDGIVQYWYDGEILINNNDVMLRTGEHPDMKFNQFLLAPYIGDGSPVEQTMWIDNLTVATSRIITSVEENKLITDGYNLSQIRCSPNPFSQSTNIDYELTVSDNVLLKIYDVYGKEVHTLIDEFQEEGSHSKVLDANGLSGGVFFYVFQIGGQRIIGKMILAR